jgi:hypothetical protein
MPQRVQEVTEVRPRLWLGRIRPEQKGEVLTWLRRVPVEQEIREERLRARRFERRQSCAVEAEFQSSEEPNLDGW